MFALCAPVFGGCVPVAGDRILGRDLAAADARFSALPATLTVGFAPVPGTKRTFTIPELARLAKANGISRSSEAEICFEIPLRHITEPDVLESMRRSLPAATELAIVELPGMAVPEGSVEFPISGLEPPQRGAQLWRGFVRYASTRKAPLWARVNVTQRLSVVIADRDLPQNVPIDATAVRVERRNTPVLRERLALRAEDVAGRIPKRSLKAGSTIPLDILGQPPAIRRGDRVRVEVRSGSARLVLEAVAEHEARDGDFVELRNPVSGRIFRARLDGSKAVIVLSAGQQL